MPERIGFGPQLIIDLQSVLGILPTRYAARLNGDSRRFEHAESSGAKHSALNANW